MLRSDILRATSGLSLICSIQYNCGWYLGAVIAAWATFGTRNYAGSWAWRVPSLLQVLLPLIGIPGLIMIPESPRWLVSKDRIEEARQNLADIHVGGDIKHPLIEFEMAEIQQTLKAEKEAEQFSAWNDLWATPGNRHRLFISISLGIFAQWAGNGVVSYYLSIILNSVGITSVDDQTLISACLQIWNLIWAVTAALLVERLGRRLLFMTSVSRCFLAKSLTKRLLTSSRRLSCWCPTSSSPASPAASPQQETPPPDLLSFPSSSCKQSPTISFPTPQNEPPLTPFSFQSYFFGYDIALTPLVVSYPIEIWPYKLRAKGLAISQMTSLAMVFFNTFVNPIALEAIDWKYYFVFLAVLISMVVSVWFWYPETRGLTLENVAWIFDGEQAEVRVVSANEVLEGEKSDEEKKRGDHVEVKSY
jgi:MFS family permease